MENVFELVPLIKVTCKRDLITILLDITVENASFFHQCTIRIFSILLFNIVKAISNSHFRFKIKKARCWKNWAFSPSLSYGKSFNLFEYW